MTLPVPLLQLKIAEEVLVQLPGQTRTTLPVPNPTRSFWINSSPDPNPLAKEGSQGNLVDDVDICIIGSGITGTSVAYNLAKQCDDKPLKAVILDARDFCSGATGRNGGHLSPNPFLEFSSREALFGPEEARRAIAAEAYTAHELVNIIKTEGLESIVDLVEGGHVAVFVTDKELDDARNDYAAAKAAGVDLTSVQWLDKDEMQKTYGTAFSGVRYAGQNLWPLKLVTELYRLASQRNPAKFDLNLHTNTPVTSITANDDQIRPWVVSTPRGNIRCSCIVHATNGYASYLLPHMHGPEGIVPTRGQVIALRSNAPSSELTKSSWGGNEGFEYWFPRPLEETEKHPLIILGGAREATGPGFEYYTADDSIIRPDVGKALRDFLPEMFPGKFEKGREPEMEWSGIMGFTKLGDPFVGPVVDKSAHEPQNFKGQFIAAGYTGHGMTRAYACAEALAGMVLAESTRTVWTQPDWLPFYFLTTIRDVKRTA